MSTEAILRSIMEEGSRKHSGGWIARKRFWQERLCRLEDKSREHSEWGACLLRKAERRPDQVGPGRQQIELGFSCKCAGNLFKCPKRGSERTLWALRIWLVAVRQKGQEGGWGNGQQGDLGSSWGGIGKREEWLGWWGERERKWLEMTHHLGGDLEGFADKMGHRDREKEAEKTM